MGIIESYEGMAERLGISKAEVVKRIKNLEQMGYLTVENNGKGANEIFVHFFPHKLAM